MRRVTDTADMGDLSWGRRFALGSYAFAATAIYAGSFALTDSVSRLLPLAAAIGLAAAVSWPLFGAALLARMKGRPSVLAWADACLRTMAVGNTVLLLSVGANLMRGLFWTGTQQDGNWPAVHLAVLLVANFTMAAVFTTQAGRLGMRPGLASLMWFGVLGGAFFLALAAMKASGVLAW